MKSGAVHDSPITYRPDVDGLRAVAVLAVIAFHVDAALLPGGFLGVDVFFVISGYLITLLLLKDRERGAWLTLVDFYRRRVQRILPALVFMMLAILPVGFVLMAPDDFRDLMWSELAALLSLANVYFYATLDTGYFAPETDDVPLLHVWSLGVEEQFYLLWPALLMLLCRVGWRQRLLVVGLGIVASLALAHRLGTADASFTYYLLPTRAWELLAGALAALLAAEGWSVRGGLWGHLSGLVGIGLVAAGLVWVDESHVVPGVAVLPVVVGTFLLVLSPAQGLAGRLLALRPMVAVGLVSYSAYLWHWPILAYLRYALVEISPPIGIAVVAATLGMAAISYRWVERPVRRLRMPIGRAVAACLGVPLAVWVLVAGPLVYAINTHGTGLYPWERYQRLKGATEAAIAYDFNCQYSRFEPSALQESRCVHPPGTEPTVLLLGDSNAAHYLGLLRVWADELGFSLRNATQSACPPLIGRRPEWVDPPFADGCAAYNDTLETAVDGYAAVVLGSSWSTHARLGGEQFLTDLEDTIRRIAARVPEVVLLAEAPSFRHYRRECEVRRIRLPALDCRRMADEPDREASVNRYLRELADRIANVHVLDVRHALCREGTCSAYFDGRPAYFDPGHISVAGSAAIGRWLLRRQDPVVTEFGRVLERAHGALTASGNAGG